jgi:lysophospholipase L1-like esterase
MDYLQLPVFPPDRYGFDGMSVEEREEYNVTTMMKTGSKYRPAHHSSQAHAALDYEISTLLKNDIHVIIVGLPHHPTALTYVEEGRWDGFNETMSKYSQWPGVTVFDQSWESGWEDEHFFDRNHLDDEGRAEFCARLAPVLEQILED